MIDPLFAQPNASGLGFMRAMLGRGCCLVLSVSIFLCAMPQGQAQVSAQTLVTVDMVEGTNMSVAVSPDGESLVIALQGVLWLLPATGGEAVALTPPELDAHEPVWSPQGDLIAFYAFAENGFSMWSVSSDGSELTAWTDDDGDSRYPSFLPDGSALLFSNDRDEGYSIWSIDRETKSQSLLIGADETGYERPMQPYFSGNGNAIYPVLSPQGDRLAFIVDGAQDALMVWDLGGGNDRLSLHEAQILGAPAWSQDGSTLYVVAVDTGSTYLAEVASDGSGYNTLVSGGDIFPFRPSVAPDGSLYYTADGQIRHMDPATRDEDIVPFVASVVLDRTPYDRRQYDFSDQSPRDTLGIIDPTLSPDGSFLVYAALGDLWSADIKSGVLRQLTDDMYIDLSPTFSPDGNALAWVSDRDGKADIWTMNLNDGSTKRLTDSDMPVNSPIWSPEGDRIAFLKDFQTSIFISATINVLELGTGNIAQVSEPIFGPSAPAWAPDGSVLAVYHRLPQNSRFREGHNAIYLVSADGVGDPQWVVPVSGKSLGRRQFNRPAWSMSGEFVYRIDGGLWRMPLTSDGSKGKATLIAASGENPNWSGNGDYLVYMDGAEIILYDLAGNASSMLAVKPQWVPEIPNAGMIVRAGKLYNGLGDSYQENVDIIIMNGIITGIEPADSSRPANSLIDASAFTVIPGLIEGHAHQSNTQGVALGNLFLSHGITSVRETGVDPYFAVERREASASGRRPAPRVFTAGPLNEGSRVSYGVSETVGTIARAEQAVELSTELQLDMLKSYVRQDYSVQKHIVALAHESGIPVSSHELYPAVANGIDQMEHFGATSRRGYSLKSSRLNYSYQDVISLIVGSGVVVTPTLAMGERPGRDMSPQFTMLRRIVEGGGRIQAGTDSPFIPHAEALHRELEIYVEAGLSPAKALRTATSESAEAIGVADQIGSIVPGLMADMVIIEGDPLANISAIRNVRQVIKSGALIWSKP
ncbi:MAG: Tol biopolymer transport system component/cytosine [Pseudohongiellaceae bacterium]|jgi:Tol biopolymer transport system component/cytosine/adenosine deaminase-related metal-dependent hydrolase